MVPGPAKRWHLSEPAPDDLLAGTPEHPLLVQVLYNRGLRTSAEIATYLQGSDAVVENPYRLRDMVPAVSRLVRAIEQGETICVYGDFDADGVSATALLVTALQLAGGQVGPYIPDRVDEGYGLNVDALERIAAKARLIVTVDCGIRAVAEVAHAAAQGMDVIVTDHHSVGPVLPPALAVINPRRKDCPSKFERLAGVGVAYRLAQAVLRAVAQEPWSQLTRERAAEIEESLLELVAIGTVADLMPLLGENRSLVRRGLVQLNQTQRPGLEALIAQAGLRPGTVDATAISFRLAPRLNAAGRLSHARLAYQLLRTTDPTDAYTLTTELETLNQRRRTLTADAEAIAEQQIAEQGFGEQEFVGQRAQPSIYIVQSEHFLPGIVGLVAGKLVDRFYRPAVVVERGVEESRGSARSIDEFDISRALDEVDYLLVRHGGHGRAAGFTVATAQLPAFTEALRALADQELGRHQDLRPTLHIDAHVDFGAINWGLLEQFARLEPTGQGNAQPLLLCRGCRVREVRTVGAGKHLRLVVDKDAGSSVLDAVAFGQGEWAGHLIEGSRIDVVFQLEANEWQARRSLQLNVLDMALTQ